MDAGRSRLRRTKRVLAACALLLLALACAIGAPKGTRGPPQAWDDRRGPVVPHDSFPRDCALCHEGSSWNRVKQDFRFDHVAETGVALLGAHAAAQCLRCHNDRGPVAAFAARGCAGCHEDVHRGRLGAQCSDCHGESDWEPRGQIAKHMRTRFPLVGAHAGVDCLRCHPGSSVGNFDAVSTRCEDCHQADLARATSPDHAMQGWTSNCDRCHISTTWGGSGFNHPIFPLSGAHSTLACAACHSGGDFTSAPTTCIGCHQADYDGTARPPHAAAGFPTTCQTCHSTASWTPASFDHSGFPLTGAHAKAACSACHGTGTYRGLPTSCVACHQAEYAATTDPNHAQVGYPTTCEQCHTTVAWTRANFDHAGVTRNCVQCHLVDYNATNDPSHAAAGFPTTCQTCHSTAHWTPATFAHPQFPINSGPHHALTCAQCHPNPRNYGQFTCTDCHEHRQSEMDSEHQGVHGYVYSSGACYQCHPDGHADD